MHRTVTDYRFSAHRAYVGPDDPASHAYRGMTLRNKVMFGDPGYAYVYFTYGMHHCLNFVTKREGFPSAVLIRALEPADGIEVMKKRRKTVENPAKGGDDLKNLTNGPAKLCQALGIDRTLNGADLCSGIIHVEDRGRKPTKIVSTSRVGIKEGKDKKWRFYVENSVY